MPRDADVDRSQRVVGGSSPLADRIPANGARFVLVEVQSQQDQQEGNANDWACSVQEGILDVVTGQECGEGDCHEEAIDQISVIVDLEANAEVTHVYSEADSTKTFNTRQILVSELA